MMDSLYSKSHIRESLNPSPSLPDEDMLWLASGSREMLAEVRAKAPALRIPAAVLVPLVERDGDWTVLLTQRAATLKDHAGQISFPGGRIEPDASDPGAAALREAHEEIGLAASFVEFAGYLPDHWVGTGFRVTPAVAFVNPAFELKIAADEVHDAFEVPNQIAVRLRDIEAPVLLVDDVIATGWTMTVAAARLRQAGARAVLPLALAIDG